jgi:hypothetical protein
MNPHVIGVYREPEFSPGKVEADQAIMDAVLARLQTAGARCTALSAAELVAQTVAGASLVLAMCQGPAALKRLVALEETGATVINSALAIRNCYRDLLGAGLTNAGVPAPEGRIVETTPPFDPGLLHTLDLTAPIYVKRGDLHALQADDVQLVEGPGQLEAALRGFARRGIERVYTQQAVAGEVVKFYGVGDGGDYFAALAERDDLIDEATRGDLARAARAVAGTLGVSVWGGDAVVAGRSFTIIDFNDWPSFTRVRDSAAAAIARHCLHRLRQQGQAGEISA